MRDKLSKTKDILVFVLSFEVNVLLTLFLFQVDIWEHIWAVARINIASLFLYGWLWFVEYYLSNWSTSALVDKQIELENKKLEVLNKTAKQNTKDVAPEQKPATETKQVEEKEDSATKIAMSPIWAEENWDELPQEDE